MTMNEEKRLYYLKQLGVQAWVPNVPIQNDKIVADGFQQEEAVDQAITISEKSAESFEALKAQVAACTLCELHRTRTQTVFGVGHPAADWLIIGEAPGADEDRKGEPFVGRAGQLLTNMLRAIGLAREEVFIANILKCRPPNNRDPKPNEVESCSSYLRQQIDIYPTKNYFSSRKNCSSVFA